MSTESNCFFCGSECEIYPGPLMPSVRDYRCKYCGPYLIDHAFICRIPGINEIENKFKIACVLNERRLKGQSGVALSNKTDKESKIFTYPQISAGELLDEFPKKSSDFLNRILLNLSRLPKRPFDVIRLNIYDTSADRLHLFALDKRACEAIITELVEQEIIRCDYNDIDNRDINLTAKCWEIVENLQQTGIDSKRVFVAMWFHESMNDYYKDGIKKAIEEAGYDPVRIGLKDFNEKICDEIIAEIKRTKFLIADFSGMRSGVFFEAGFAKGLGREVIFTVREDDINGLKEHFDTRQYNHIVYDSAEDLRKKLYNRICATIV